LPNKRSGFNAPENEEAAYYNIDRLDVESSDSEVSLYDYGKREGELILEHFGNHPSFVMFTLGNELGRNEGMFELVAHFKELDPRRLYAQGSNNMHWNPSLAEGDDFWVTGKVGDDILPIRGSFYLHDYPYGAVDTFPPGTMDDFSDSIRSVPVPLIGHETGQYQVSPDYRDIPKFTGVLEARNYEIFREQAREAGMLDQAHDFVRASGALAAICYREDIEIALRTPGFGGFQLLDINDFPDAKVSLHLNDSKGKPIDNFDRNHKLGLIFETKVDQGSMLVCAIDLPAIQDQPEGRQMLHSLLEYVGSDAFQPKTRLSTETLKDLLP